MLFDRKVVSFYLVIKVNFTSISQLISYHLVVGGSAFLPNTFVRQECSTSYLDSAKIKKIAELSIYFMRYFFPLRM